MLQFINRSASMYHYQIPLIPSVSVATRLLSNRQGLLLRLQAKDSNGDSCEGWGEISPLPGYSEEDLSHCQMELITLALDWLTSDPQTDPQPVSTHSFSMGCSNSTHTNTSASTRFGFSCACYELQHGPLATLPGQHVTSYPLITSLSGSDQLLETPLMVNVGEPTSLKLKLARQPLLQEIEQVQQLLQYHPDLRLRIDCNQGWTFEQARQFLALTPTASIEYLEEPCLDLEQTLQLAESSEVSVALDETLRLPQYAENPDSLPKHQAICALVIKPSLTGSLDQVHTWIELGKQRNLRTILSSSYESSLALSQIEALAQQWTPLEAPGLDTADAFSVNLIRGGDPIKPTLPPEALECLWHS
ncbi:MAG: o-succinylbenzoate synthase [Motiliproteus sp.]